MAVLAFSVYLSSVVFLQILTRYGAELVFCTPTPTGRKETADKIAADTGGVAVHSEKIMFFILKWFSSFFTIPNDRWSHHSPLRQQ